jgi:hypothetical protein
MFHWVIESIFGISIHSMNILICTVNAGLLRTYYYRSIRWTGEGVRLALPVIRNK